LLDEPDRPLVEVLEVLARLRELRPQALLNFARPVLDLLRGLHGTPLGFGSSFQGFSASELRSAAAPEPDAEEKGTAENRGRVATHPFAPVGAGLHLVLE